jgi:hypothetical protein
MKVERIVANMEAHAPAAAKRFYQDVLGLEVLMGLGWIATYGSGQKMNVQISFVSHSCRRRGFLLIPAEEPGAFGASMCAIPSESSSISSPTSV